MKKGPSSSSSSSSSSSLLDSTTTYILWMLSLFFAQACVQKQRLPGWISGHSGTRCRFRVLLLQSSCGSRTTRQRLVASAVSQRSSSSFSGDETGQLPDAAASSTTRMNKSTEDVVSYRVFLSVGSNLGDKYGNIQRGLQLLCHDDDSSRSISSNSSKDGVVKLKRTSFLYQTDPMYVTDQPLFLNGAVELETTLAPLQLLDRIKRVEQQMGRNLTHSQEFRNGPRPLDLDILFYDQQLRSVGGSQIPTTSSTTTTTTTTTLQPVLVEADNLTIPHPLLAERDFVLTPLLDVATGDYVHPRLKVTLRQLQNQLLLRSSGKHQHQQPLEEGDCSTNDVNNHNHNHNHNHNTAKTPSTIARVLPLPRNRLLSWNNDSTQHHPYGSSSSSSSSILIMGILNVTPDSFSDGGQWYSSDDPTKRTSKDVDWVARAVDHAVQMEQQGAALIDIGGESTRPGAQPVPVDEELQRTIPVIARLRQVSDICISIDTRNAAVAQAAIQAGADMVNDVSGGCHDPAMLETVASLGVPMILMHMRGTPQTMQSMTQYSTTTTVEQEVAEVLMQRVQAAEQAGISRWQLVVDPGIGFAKDQTGNLRLLKHLSQIRASVNNLPLLVGTSRKGFLGKLASVAEAQDRDFATIASLVTPACLESSAAAVAQREHGNPFLDGLAPTTNQSCTIWRVHNVAAAYQAMKIMKAIQQA
ncbi:hypothetical protein ACA910_018061 [Epithemia clementina (nom. ined.)]